MKLHRYRLRTLLIAVAVIAVAIGALVLWQRSIEYRKRAEDHAVLEQRCLRMAQSSLELAAIVRANFASMRRQIRETGEKQRATWRQRLQVFAKDAEPGGEDARKIAQREAEIEKEAAAEEADFDRQAKEIERQAEKDEAAARVGNTWAEYHAELRRKYEWAARYPWLHIEPDPPEPSPKPRSRL